ncbi:MAG TPA: D-alanyl-D-alanine carboxypeptidase family protein [Syntrophorhabdaceae bacterium]|nr:D-alanyl-D-alanine carboxypeptidase family protein [Syntrophorhabdaceae bacterium]HPU30344.1 D-alanyl-D-alanine carboxypeptidase family protein [Syntrophorhabdaceae bacterium]
MDKLKKLLIIILILFCSVSIVHARSKLSVQKKAHKHEKTEKVEPYKAFIVTEASTGRMLEGENIHEKRPPASVTKLMLAYIVMDKLNKKEINLTDKITISKEASKIGGSQVYLKEGEVFTLEDLMKATLIASGNDAAYAVAEYVAGSKDEFVKLMNEKAKALGMNDTEFNSVHGLPPSKGQKEDLSSCHDLAILAKELLKYPKIIEWTSIKSEGFRDGKFIMNNHNKLLTKMPGIVDGLKTGYYRETGFNIVATGKKDELRFIVVVMGSPSAKVRDDVVMEKFRKAFAQYKIINVVKKGEVIDKDIFLIDGKYKKIKGVTNAGFTYPVPNDKKDSIKKEIVVQDKVKGEVKEGQKVGEVIIKMDDRILARVDIVSPVYVPKANLFTRLIRRLGLNI